MKILVVEDNYLLGKSIKQGLQENGWVVDLAVDGEEGSYHLEVAEYDIVVLDWMLPKQSGIDLLKKIQSHKRPTPTIMITAKGEVMDRVEGLNKGADDYLVKPFEMVELIARINSVYRRSLAKGSASLKIGALTIDLIAHEIKLHDELLDLTGKEYDLLECLASKSGQLVKRTTISSLLYQFDGEPDSNSLDVLLARVRKKLAGSDVEIATIRGKGFILRVATPTP